jgi:hypothetical protein
MAKIHSREWFMERIAETKREIASGPAWMQGETTVAASFPHTFIPESSRPKTQTLSHMRSQIPTGKMDKSSSNK